MKMDVSKFKKVSSDDKKTVLKHPRGHEIVIAHAALSPGLRKQMNAIPMADGGEVPEESIWSKIGKAAGDAENFGLGLAKKAIVDPYVNLYDSVSSGLHDMGQGFMSKVAPDTMAPAPAAAAPAQVPDAGPAPASLNPPTPAPLAPAQGAGISGDPMGLDAYAHGMMGAIGEQKRGLQQEAAAQGELGKQQMAAEKEQQALMAAAQQDYQKHYQDLQNEYQNVIHDVQNQHINPNHYMESMSTGKRIATVIGLIMGGANAQQFLQKQIENDVEAQKANLGKSQNLLAANLRQFGNLHDATQMTLAMQNGIYASKLRQAAAQAMDPVAKARALQEAGKLDMQAAPIIQQLAMKKMAMSGMTNIQDPAQKIRFGTMVGMIPKEESEHLYKELDEAQGMVKARDHLLSALDKVAKLNTLSNRAMSPIQSKAQMEAITGPLVAQLSKDTAGRFTEQDAAMLAPLFKGLGDNDATVAEKRRQAIALVEQKMNFPRLKAYGIDPFKGQRYGEDGQKTIQLGPPVK